MRYKRLLLLKSLALGALGLLVAVPIGANDLSRALAATEVINEAGRVSQGVIDTLVKETQTLNVQYKVVLKEIEGLRVYNEQQRKQIAVQEKSMEELRHSINQVTVVQRQILPLMIRMVDGLEQFVSLDVPFQLEERTKRIERLREIIGRSDVVVSEKFSAVLNAYQIETEYGRTIEAYSDQLPGTSKVVDFLRFGRITLVYQTTDGAETGVWNKHAENFELLDSSYNSHIKYGIRMARKQAAVDMVVLPVSGPEDAR